ncbi:gliding motility-associated C-terminal domain-containing protein, partial [Cesiribacter sp. SM1]|uniref:gliding motility-associated C-terminal domain-containing protein n=1 Tax=Cesiribacter sp. SM1 TaxID=2861196 RepID=UPI001CD767A1
MSEAPCAGLEARVTADSHQQTCKNPFGGKLSVEIYQNNKRLNNGSFSYSWYPAEHVNEEAYKLATGTSVSQLTAGTYVVVVEDLERKCEMTATGVVKDETPVLEFSLDYIKNTVGCDADPVGEIRLNNPKNYKINWYSGTVADPDKNIPKYQSLDYMEFLPPGTYTIVATNEATGCTTTPIQLTVDGYPTSPIVTATVTPDLLCNGSGSGAIATTIIPSATGDIPAGGYSYTWYNASGTELSQFRNQPNASPLPVGTYSIRVAGIYTDMSLTCDTLVSFTVPHQPVHPVLSLSALPNSICDPQKASNGANYTGSITAAVTNNGQSVTDFSGYTFSWVDANGNSGTVNGTNQMSSLPGGTYTVTATNSGGCSSDPVNVVINNATPTLSLSLTPTAQSSCGSPYNGSISASLSKDGSTLASGYQLEWFIGTSTSGAAVPAASISGNTASGLQGGLTYTVRATDNSTGCQTTAAVLVPVQENSITPAYTVVPNSICDTGLASSGAQYTGAITVTAVDFNGSTTTDLSGYSFNWYKESGGSFSLIAGASSTSLSNLPTGSYQVVATHNSLGCSSDPLTVVVNDNTPTLSLSLTPTAQSSCGSLYNGSISASLSKDGSTLASGYQLEWFIGTSASGAAVPAASISGNTATGLQGGQTYTVRATDNSTGCQTTASVFVAQEDVSISLNYSSTPNGICDPALAAANYSGSISISSVDFNGSTTADLSGYSFRWYKEDGGSFTLMAGETSSSLSQLGAGRYQVVATRTDLACSSDPLTVTISNSLPALSLSLTPTAQSSCGSLYNGSISASLSKDGSTLASGYQLEWFIGTSTSGAAVPAASISGNTASGLQGGLTYTVRATDNSTGCQTTAAVLVPVQENSITPAYTVVPNSICDTGLASSGAQYTGAITVTGVDFNGSTTTDLSGYSFSWYKESGGSFSLIAGASSTSLSNLPTGSYQVVATHNSLGCSSDPLTVVVNDNTPTLSLSLTPTAQSSCGSLYNGSISASLSKDGSTLASGYQLEWFIGTSASGAAVPAASISGNTASGLQGGQTYTVRATDNSTGCQTTASVFVAQEDVSISLNYSSTPNGICDPALAAANYSGSISISSVDFNGSTTADLSGYSFRWYKEDGGSFTLMAGETSSSLSQLGAGRYQVVATRTDLACSSDPLTVTISNSLPALSLSLTPTAQSSCGSLYNGSISASLSKDGSTLASGYQLEWFVGTSTSGAAVPAASISGNTASGLQGGQTYTVRATDNSTGCKTIANIFVPEQESSITLTYSTISNNICDPSLATNGTTYQGGIVLSDILLNNIAEADFSQYSISWYKQSGSSYTLIAGENASSLSNIDNGNYQVEAVHKQLGCSTGRISIVVDETTTDPEVSIAASPQVNCQAPFSGTLTASVQSGGVALPLSDYRFEWFTGTTTQGTALTANLSGTNNSQANKLASGYYTLRATNLNTGCVTVESKFLEEILVEPGTTIAVQNIQSCNPSERGSLTASVFINGAEVTDYSHYTFSWYRGQSATGTPLPGTGRTLTDLDASGTPLPSDDYTVVATNTQTSCKAPEETAFLQPAPPLFTISTYLNRAPSSCNEDGGVITAWVNDGSGRNVNDYTFEWYAGQQTDPDANFYTDPPIQFNGGPLATMPLGYDASVELPGQTAETDYYTNGATLFSRGAGIYTVVATRKGDGCKELAVVEVPYIGAHMPELVGVTNSVVCPGGTGSIEVRVTDANGAPFADQSKYKFYLFAGSNPGDTVTAPFKKWGQPTATEFNNLTPGTYTFLVKEFLTPEKCISISKTVEIKQIAKAPVVRAGDIVASNMCEGGNGSVLITLGAAPSDDATTQFSISWLSAPGAMPADLLNQPAGSYPFSALEAGTYTATVSGSTGCSTDISFTIPGQPVVPVVQATGTHQTDCVPANGSITINGVSLNGAAASLANYTFSWYKGAGNLASGTFFYNGTQYTTDTLSAGTYYLVAKQNAGTGAGSGCSAAPLEVIIRNLSNATPISLSATQNTSCDDQAYNGTVSADISAVSGNYSYQWYKDDVAYGAAGTQATPPALTAAGPGVYRLELKESTGCVTTAQVEVTDDLEFPVITTTAALPQTSCTSGDGSASVTAITYGGAAAALADFSFSWTDAAGNTYSGASISSLTAGTYTVVATKTANPGKGCASAPVQVVVGSNSAYPSISLSTTANSSCDNTSFTGTVTAKVTSPTTDYSYQWYKDGVALGAAGTQATLAPLTAVGPGVYRLEITAANGCPVAAEAEVKDKLLPIHITTTAALPQTSCTSGDGSASVTAITYGGAAAALADFSFSWTDAAGNTYSGASIDKLVAGTYTVVATKTANPGKGCASAPVQVVVGSNSAYPSISLSTTANSSCDNTSFTGTVTAKVTSPTTDYSYQWYKDGVAFGAAGTQATLAPLTAVGPGVYRLEITAANGCPVAAEAEVKDKLLPIHITTTAALPQTSCTSGDGSASVTAITYGGTAAALADFSFSWTDAAGNTYSGASISSLTAGTYTVVATKTANPGKGCASAPVQVVVNPPQPTVAVALSGVNFSACDNTPNGSLTATVTGAGSYSYVLYKNGVATTFTGNNVSTTTLSFSNLEAAQYRLDVTDNNTCPATATLTIAKEVLSGSITLSHTDQSTCNNDGSLSVTQIDFGNQLFKGADILGNFNLQLLSANGTVLANTAVTTATGASFRNLPAGLYSVKAVKRAGKGLNCSLTATDQLRNNSVKPTLQLVDKKMISRCFGQTGLLAVSIDGNISNGGRYTVDWMYRQTLSNSYTTVAGTGFSITDLNAGYYTINVRDNVTNCTISQEFLIEEVVVELALSASASDQTNCDPDNGQIFVRVANLSDLEGKLGNNLTFDFEVYAGELSAPPANTSPSYKVSNATSFSRVDVAGPSAYTVFAWFNGHRVCVGNDIAYVGYVDNKPAPVIEQETSLTICDPGNPNASASASVNGLTEGYSFTWYKETVSVDNRLAQTGPVVTNLGLTDYIVEVQNLITGCIGYDTVSINALFPPVAFDSAMLTATISNNCAVPNGTLEVNVASGERDKFAFTWYRGTTANPDSLLPAGTVPYRQEGLAEGYYTVVARDLENGCLSDAVVKHVGGEYVFPDFEIKVEPATCSQPGTARVVGVGGEMMDYYIYDAHGSQISDQNTPLFVGPAGHYWLRVISPDGCDKQLPFEITEAVLPHNGVTANGDGVNDFMMIECIHLYPENKVRIYNRAGGLVFEMSGYDNNLRVFDGTGNRGLYLGNKQLPAG